MGAPLRRSLVRLAVTSIPLVTAAAPASASETTIDPRSFHVVRRDSGPVNYYMVLTEEGRSFIRARYEPPTKTTVLGWQTPDGDRRAVRKVRWSWRALTLPKGGDECNGARADSAAVVYVTWKRGLKYYTIKYVWSAVGNRGRVCDVRRNLFVAQDTVIRQTGEPLDTWRTEEIDLATEFRRHFEGGDPDADVPDFVGLGIMSDGDQTGSESAADYGPFVLVR